MSTACLLALLLLISTHAGAQNRKPTDVSLEVNKEISLPNGFTPVPITTASLPEAPTPHKVIDKKFVFITGALGGAEALRFTSRRLVLENEFAAGAPWVTRVPSNQHDVAGHAGIFAAELLVTYELKKPHSWLPGDRVIRRLWWAYPAAMAVIHVKNGVGNIGTQGPGGCTSVECAAQMQ